VFQIRLESMALSNGCQTPSSARPVAQYRREEAGRVEPRQTAPINRPIIANKGHRPSVVDDTVGTNLLVCRFNRNRKPVQVSNTLSSALQRRSTNLDSPF